MLCKRHCSSFEKRFARAVLSVLRALHLCWYPVETGLFPVCCWYSLQLVGGANLWPDVLAMSSVEIDHLFTPVLSAGDSASNMEITQLEQRLFSHGHRRPGTLESRAAEGVSSTSAVGRLRQVEQNTPRRKIAAGKAAKDTNSRAAVFEGTSTGPGTSVSIARQRGAVRISLHVFFFSFFRFLNARRHKMKAYLWILFRLGTSSSVLIWNCGKICWWWTQGHHPPRRDLYRALPSRRMSHLGRRVILQPPPRPHPLHHRGIHHHHRNNETKRRLRRTNKNKNKTNNGNKNLRQNYHRQVRL